MQISRARQQPCARPHHSSSDRICFAWHAWRGGQGLSDIRWGLQAPDLGTVICDLDLGTDVPRCDVSLVAPEQRNVWPPAQADAKTFELCVACSSG